MSIDDVDRLAKGQHGLVTLAQALECGLSRSMVRRWLAIGRLTPMYAGVYRMAGAPPIWEQSLLAAVLAAGPGSAASHRAAARLWDLLDDTHERVVEISVPRGRLPRLGGVVVHRSNDLDVAWVTRRHGIPVTTPARTVVDLGAVAGARFVEDALDRGLVTRLVTVAGVEHALAAVARRGRSGAGVVRSVLERRALGDSRPDGLLEPRMARLLSNHGLPIARFQHQVHQGSRLVARVDFAYPELRLAVEVDGFSAHSSPSALQADLERQNALVALGWTVLRFTWADVVQRPEAVASRVRHLLGTLRSA